MKKFTAFIFCSYLLVGCQKQNAPINFESAGAVQNQNVSELSDEGDLSPEDLEEIEDQNGDDTEVILPVDDEEDLDPMNPLDCDIVDETKVATTDVCLEMIEKSQSYLALDSGVSIKDFRGNLKVKTDHVVAIENTNGNLFLVGIGDAYIEKIYNTKGNLTICNMDIGSVESVSLGNIRIDGGSVCKISGHRGNVIINNGNVNEANGNSGNIKVMNGNIGSVSDNKGNIYVTDGNIGDVDGHRGTIRVKNGTITGTVTNNIGIIKVD